jgi:hypothetical protein
LIRPSLLERLKLLSRLRFGYSRVRNSGHGHRTKQNIDRIRKLKISSVQW